MWWLFVILFLFIVVDFHYILRNIALAVIYTIRTMFGRKSILDETIFYGICLPTDIDFFLHMNNTRYLREAEFSRLQWFIETSTWNGVKKLGGSGATTLLNIRYRREIRVFDVFIIRTRLIYWDDRAFYLEQIFETKKDAFVRAINIAKVTLIRTTPSAVIHEVYGENIERPEPPAELSKLLEYAELSSEKLKKKST